MFGQSHRFVVVWATCLLLTAFSFQVVAQSYASKEGDSISPTFYAKFGYFYPKFSTSIRLDNEKGRGTEIGLEDELKLSEELGVFRFDGMIQLSRRSQIVASYTYFRRDRTLALERDLTFRDVTLEAGSGGNYKFDVDYIAATYRHSFFSKLNWNAGLSAGLRAVFIDTEFNSSVNDFSFRESASFVAPALLIGMHGGAYLTPRLLARYSLELMYVTISDIDIRVVESNAEVQYFIFDNVGLGLSYSTNLYRVNQIPFTTRLDGKVNFEFGGLDLFLVIRI